ncbi:CRTAC1 family protein [Pontibacter sp. G13]|uniref:CRTAC1 family protein n=1 Tax=Pontibacter sp. G13 TaxID=3074898 RepID=UPI002889F3D7|nr:CRTAC1 family protein [Pontibacter sp. G13]WNJ18771.1 CRTAC1 family protein [Pontibacter sp. G13]
MSKRLRSKKALRRLLLAITVISLLIVGARVSLQVFAGEDAVNIAGGLIRQMVGLEAPSYDQSTEFSQSFTGEVVLDGTIVPFEEIGETLGDAAKGNNVITFRGMTILDANGDGKLDLYFAHSGRPLAKRDDSEQVLQPSEFVPAKPNTLYLNQGNDEKGHPIFKSVPDLIAGQNRPELVTAELLCENKYVPRTSVEEDPHGVGRVAFGAVSADFNGDGRVDLLVLNHHYGMPMIALEYGIKVFPPSENIGRAASEKRYIRTTLPPYLAGDMKDGMHAEVDFGGTPEPEGRNSLYLNLGDRDGDGIPEWEDATVSAGMHSTNWSSASATIGDMDRDGDLDIYIVNFIDPDFWGFGATEFAGHPNELWVNQLSETGKMSFVEMAAEFGVAGLHEEEDLPSSMWDPKRKAFFDDDDQIYDGEPIGKRADHSWAAQLVDFTQDGWPDLIVANDIGNRLRVYENLQGKGFKVFTQFHDAQWNGSWMGLASGDLDGDMTDEIMATSFGTQSVSLRNTAIFADDPDELNLAALSTTNYLVGKASTHHALISYNGVNFDDRILDAKVEHSPYIAPDITLRQNVAPEAFEVFDKFKYDQSLAALEFAWNPIFFDVDNDSDLDIYTVGSLSRGNDNFFGEMTNSVGRMMVNETQGGNMQFRDRTLEYQVLDIAEMDYSVNPPRRKAPGTNWHKRDYIYLQDVDAFADMGFEASKNSKVKDLFRLHESANCVVNADLNGDGFQDMVVCHAGGNNSNLPSARNLKVEVMGRKMAMPPPNKVIKAPTQFEDGPTFLYVNQGVPEGIASNWVTLELIDGTTENVFGIGAKVVVNGKIMRRHLIGGQSFSGVHAPLHIGLGNERLETVEIFWGSGSQKPQLVEFGPAGPANQQVTIVRE